MCQPPPAPPGGDQGNWRGAHPSSPSSSLFLARSALRGPTMPPLTDYSITAYALQLFWVLLSWLSPSACIHILVRSLRWWFMRYFIWPLWILWATALDGLFQNIVVLGFVGFFNCPWKGCMVETECHERECDIRRGWEGQYMYTEWKITLLL